MLEKMSSERFGKALPFYNNLFVLFIFTCFKNCLVNLYTGNGMLLITLFKTDFICICFTTNPMQLFETKRLMPFLCKSFQVLQNDLYK